MTSRASIFSQVVIAKTEAKEMSGLVTGNASEALAAAQVKIEEENKAALGEALVVLLRHTKARKDRHILSIREKRRQIENTKSQLAEIDRAFKYGEETDNWVPLAVLVDSVNQFDIVSGVATKVPEDWKPKQG
jgi:hypothetical protein